MKFKTKLFMSIGSLLLLITIIVMILMHMLEQSTLNLNVVVNDLHERVKIASDIKYEISTLHSELEDYQKGEVSNEGSEYLGNWEDLHTTLQLQVEKLKEMDNQEKTQELVEKFTILHQSYRGVGEAYIASQKLDSDEHIQSLFVKELELTRTRMTQIAEVLYSLQEQEMKNELLRSKETYHLAVRSICIYLAVGLTIGIGFTIWIIFNMTRNLNRLTFVMKRVLTSDFEQLPRISISSKDEIGEISSAFNKMAMTLENHIKIEKQLIGEAEELSWLKTKVAEIATMYPEAENIKMLADGLMSKLVPMVDGCVGVFYIKESDQEGDYLKQMSTYALMNHQQNRTLFRYGEGLVGQCAIEKKMLTLSGHTDPSFQIWTGVGAVSPVNIIVFPVLFEGEVMAVIEVASFYPFSSLQIRLLEEVNQHIGITCNSIYNRMKADRLLKESQALADELQSQSLQLQQQQEKLRRTNEKLEIQYATSEQKKKEVEKVREDLEDKARQLELSSKYKSEFLANMSHELRTPLNNLLILAQILAENSDGHLSDKQREYTKTIYSSGRDLLNLINDILDLAKVEAGKLEIMMKKVHIDEVNSFIASQFSPIVCQKGLKFDLTVSPEVPESFETDEQRLKQILKNLLSNAVKFTESGQISLFIQRIPTKELEGSLKTKFERVEHVIKFVVQDTGIGISKDKIDLIFDAFKQADGTTSRLYGGTGLGLSISRKLSKLLGGQLEVESEEGIGSTFSLFLPLHQQNNQLEGSVMREVAVSHEAATPRFDKEGKALTDKKVLLVDDDIRNIYALTVALERYELDIMIAENGKEALEILNKNKDIDLILMDIMMPEIDGIEMMKKIRDVPSFHSIPLIAMTAKATKNCKEECYNAGADAFLSKPIQLVQLYGMLQEFLTKVENEKGEEK